MSKKCHYTVTVISLVLRNILSHYCGVKLTSIRITVKTTVETTIVWKWSYWGITILYDDWHILYATLDNYK